MWRVWEGEKEREVKRKREWTECVWRGWEGKREVERKREWTECVWRGWEVERKLEPSQDETLLRTK